MRESRENLRERRQNMRESLQKLRKKSSKMQEIHQKCTPLQLRPPQKITKFPPGIASPYTNHKFATPWHHPLL